MCELRTFQIQQNHFRRCIWDEDVWNQMGRASTYSTTRRKHINSYKLTYCNKTMSSCNKHYQNGISCSMKCASGALEFSVSFSPKSVYIPFPFFLLSSPRFLFTVGFEKVKGEDEDYFLLA